MATQDTIDSFDALLEAAHRQPQPQRLLMVFVNVVLPDDADEHQANRYQAGQGGGLVPVMYVDKAPDELTDFNTLVDESEFFGQRWKGKEWHMVIVASLSGKNGRAPTAEDAEEPIKNLVRTIHTGGDLSGFATFNRQGEPVHFQ